LSSQLSGQSGFSRTDIARNGDMFYIHNTAIRLKSDLTVRKYTTLSEKSVLLTIFFKPTSD
jgi:hypothetical protein